MMRSPCRYIKNGSASPTKPDLMHAPPVIWYGLILARTFDAEEGVYFSWENLWEVLQIF